MDGANPADVITKGWKAAQQLSSVAPATLKETNPADTIVNGFLGKNDGQPPNPLDDSSISVKAAQSDIGSQDYTGLCERFAEKAIYGKSGMYPSAAAAWNSYIDAGKAYSGDKPPAGALVYFSPDSSNNGDGHVGVSDGNGGFISATSNGVQQIPIADWSKTTGQKMLGYVIP